MDDLSEDSVRGFRKIVFYPLVIGGPIVFGVWLYTAPYLVLHNIREAARSGDAETLSQLVDFPILRERLKETLQTQLLQTTDEYDIDPLLESVIAPGGIAAMMQGKRPVPEQPHNGSHQNNRVVLNTETSTTGTWAKAKMGYAGLSKFIVRFQDKDTGKDSIVWTLKRQGLSWLLSSARFPLLLNDVGTETTTPTK